MKRIRQYAQEVGHRIVGILTRREDLEYELDRHTLEKIKIQDRCYMDEAGNQYWTLRNCICIVTADGGVI